MSCILIVHFAFHKTLRHTLTSHLCGINDVPLKAYIGDQKTVSFLYYTNICVGKFKLYQLTMAIF